MSITIKVTQTAGGSFSASGVTTDSLNLTVGGGIGPPGAGNVALAAGTGIAISTVAGVATISSSVQGVSGSNLADLADVAAAAPTSGQVLEWNGTAWAPGLDSTLTLSSTGGSDLGASAAGTSSEAARADHVHNLPALADLVGVSLGTPSTGEVLAYNGTAWAPTADNALTLATAAGADLGTAAAGSAGVAARADHVHNLPTFAEITNGTATVTGDLTLNASTGGVIVNGGSGAGSLTLNCEQNTHGVTIASPAHSVGATYTLTLPATAGSANQVLTTDGTGSLSWSNGTSGGGGGISWSSVPTDSNANGTAGEVAYDSQGYFYLHDGTLWRRIQLATFGVVPTERLLTETGDSLLSETGDYIAHDGNPAQITITSQPQNATTSGATASFSVTATVSDSSTITYQWQEFTGAIWADISAATSSTLTLGGLTSSDNGNQYRVNVSSDTATTVTSDVATLTVQSASNWSLVNTEIEPNYGYLLRIGGSGNLVHVHYTVSTPNLVVADNGTSWEPSLNMSQWTSLTGKAGMSLTSESTSSSSGIGYGRLLLAREANVAYGVLNDATNGRSLYRLLLQSGAWAVSPSSQYNEPISSGESSVSMVSCSRNGDYFALFKPTGVVVFDASGSSWVTVGTVASFWTNDSQVRHIGVSNNGLVCSIAVENTHDQTTKTFDRVRSFEWTGTTWAERTTLTVASSYVCDWTSDHSRVVIGQYDHTGTATEGGRVQVFALSGSTWSQVGSDILGDANYDYLGYSVSISSDGNTIAVGVRGEDDAGANAGAARVYEWSGGDWQQVGAAIDGEAAGDYAGDQVELSGGRVAISAPGADGAGTDAGQIRVFEAT